MELSALGSPFLLGKRMTQILSNHVTWPLWQCLSNEALIKLILYQWENYGLKLELLSDAFREVESLEEIGRLMRIPTKWRLAK